jgi:ubiquitin carboxyl-terminal hydrolase
MPSPTAAVAAAATSLSTQTAKAHNHNLAPQPPRVLYRLAAVVCHYGQHSFGHYVCFRRKPRGLGRDGPPRLNERFHAKPGRGWLRASDDAVREVGIETVLQEGSGAFMHYYERVKNEDKPTAPVWSQHSRAAMTDDDDDDDHEAEEIDDGDGDQEKARTYRSQQDVEKCEADEEVDDEMEEARVIKARVVRSVSLGAGDDFGGALVTVRQEALKGGQERERDEDGDEGRGSEARFSRSRPSSPTPPTKSENIEVEPTVELLPTSVVSAEAPSPIPDVPAVDKPPIGTVSQSVDLRA